MPGWTWDEIDNQVTSWLHRGELSVETATAATDLLVLLSRRFNPPDSFVVLDHRIVADWFDENGASIRMIVGSNGYI